MDEWLKTNFISVISTAGGLFLTAWGGVFFLFKWHSNRLDEKLSMQVSAAVNMATSEMLGDLVSMHERVTSLEAHFVDSREDIAEIKGKLDDLGGHLVSLPSRIAEVLKKGA